MLKARSQKRRNNPLSNSWRKAKNLILAKSGAPKETSLQEPDSMDWLICPHDTTSGLGVKRGAERKSSGKTPANIF